MANALADESSPYLRQHAHNPVDWLPWGPQALARAQARGVPVLVSIGYSACHWCHVMERESFEDRDTAAQMNAGFVCVKVDREERPDVDALYMEAVQGMTGHGGWPLNVFLTPAGVPFYGGTYFPPEPRPGAPSFRQVLLAVSEAWRERGEEIVAGGERMRARLVGGAALRPSAEGFDERTLDAAVQRLRESFDAVHGGFGGAPKFPQAPVLEFLLCRAGAARGYASAAGADAIGSEVERSAGQMALYTLRSMAGGGIHDLVGGGFHRYSVDARWTVPHFEKMLYDNALLTRAYLHGAQLVGDGELLAASVDTLEWVLREMRGPEGGFYAALDADSEGVEGRYYVWTVAELREALGPDAEAAIRWFGASEQGNFTGEGGFAESGANVLEDSGQRPDAATRGRIRAALLQTRERRPRPGLDDKRLTSWNALAICALAEVGAHLAGRPAGEPVAAAAEPVANGRRYLEAAIACAEFVLRELLAGRPEAPSISDRWQPRRSSIGDRGGLLRTYSGGQAKIPAYLEDHAYLLEALLALFEATCEQRWLEHACALADTTIARFGDPEHGGFFSTAVDGEALIARRKELEDSPIPAGSSSAALGLLRLAQLTGEDRYERASAGAIALVSQIAPRHPAAFGHMLQAMHWSLAPMRPVACELPPR